MRLASIAAVAVALSTAAVAAPATAQSPYGGYGGGYASGYDAYSPPRSSYGSGHGHRGRYDFNGQADRPGDYRCDAYWDAARTDCGALWRDQRPVRARTYGYDDGRYGYGYRTNLGSSPSVYPGAYGRPDLIYPGGGSRQAYSRDAYGRGRDPHRIDWCRAAYRSYDPASGYYRAYSGRLIFCG